MTSDLPTIADNLLSITVDYGGAPVRLYGPDETPDSVPEAMLPARILLYGAGRAAGSPFGFIAIGTMADVEWTLIDLLLIGPVSQGRGLLDVARATLQYMSDYAEAMRAFRQPGGTGSQSVLTQIAIEPGVYAYPLGSSNSYHGVLCTHTIREVLSG